MTTPAADDLFLRWMTALESRHLAELDRRAVARALRALSSTYVERRDRLAAGAALDGAGKRAAFALYYGPRHFQLLQGIVRALPGALAPMRTLLDLGCGTGVAGAAWGTACAAPAPLVTGLDVHPWATGEAAFTYRHFGLAHDVGRVPAARARLARLDGVVAAFVVNELDDAARATLLPRLIDAHRTGTRVLVVEPLARRATPWWRTWSQAVTAAGGRDDEWRLDVGPPPLVQQLGLAAGLDTTALAARTLYLP